MHTGAEKYDFFRLLVDIWKRYYNEKNRAFMWRYGLLEIPEFCEEVMSWGDTISYPGNDL